MNSITTSIRAELLNITTDEDALIHERLMRPQQSAIRFAYNRLAEGKVEKCVWQKMWEIFFTMTGRDLNDAICSAEVSCM